MRKELVLVIAFVCFLAGGLSACSHKQACPPCQTGLGQAPYVPQAQAAPTFAQESAPTSRRASIK